MTGQEVGVALFAWLVSMGFAAMVVSCLGDYYRMDGWAFAGRVMFWPLFLLKALGKVVLAAWREFWV